MRHKAKGDILRSKVIEIKFQDQIENVKLASFEKLKPDLNET